MLTKLQCSNFTTFDEISIDFSPKINVLVGKNGTGKTHLLKTAYVLCCGGQYRESGKTAWNEKPEDIIAKDLIRTFLPLDDSIRRLARKHIGYARLSAYFANDERIQIRFSSRAKSIKIEKDNYHVSNDNRPVFIPTKEVLSFMKGFSSLYEKYDLSFDKTYQDICLLLNLNEVRKDALHPKSAWAMDEIEKICGGRFVFNGAGTVTFITNGTEYSVNVMAEGFRKAGLLARLLETGAIRPGISGPLFWDEPEANLNPKLLQPLVEILLELSRNGQQVILATHNYFLLKWLDLLTNKGKEDHVRYHALSCDPVTNEIRVDSVDNYHQISSNAISEAFGDLTDFEIDRSMGGLGK